MRRILPFLIALVATACALPESHWEKEGADLQMTANDLAYCRAAARNEAFAAYPFPYGSPFYGYPRGIHMEDERFFAESRLTTFCMRNKGYQSVTLNPPQATTPTK